MNQERVRANDRPQRFSWPWRRQPATLPDAPAHATSDARSADVPTRGGFSWFRRATGGSARARPTQVPALRLARDWVLASGGRLREDSPDVVMGMLPDGKMVRYTSSVLRARRDDSLTLLGPGTSGLESLLDGIATAGNGLCLRLDAGRTSADMLARAAFVPSTPQSEACLAAEGVCPVCWPGAGQYMVLRTQKGIKDAQVVRRWEGVALEYAFHVAITTPRGRREELVRLGVDATTGTRLAPVHDTSLARAQAAPAESAALMSADETLARAQKLLEPAIQAAARLARVQVLPEYQRRQEEIEMLFSRLIAEQPDHGELTLEMRARELRKLADSHAVEVDVRLVSVAALLSPHADVRVRFAGGGETTVEVDLTRGTVTPPRCEICGNTWQVGARCGEGHITCRMCQAQCVHCGARHCRRCSSPTFSPCPTCAETACPACARVASGGRHRVLALDARHTHDRFRGDELTVEAAATGDPGGADDLRLDDLDAMTPATWRACMEWMLEGYGYVVERELSGADDEPALVCRRTGAAEMEAPWSGVSPAAVLVALGYRPAERSVVADDVLDRAQRLAKQVPGARGVVITTGRVARRTEATHGIDVLARDQLGTTLGALGRRYSVDKTAAARKMEARAQAASSVRATLMSGLDTAALVVSNTSLASAPRGGSVTPGRRIAVIREGLQVSRQALAAVETLIEEWEAAFPSTPTREGTQAIAAETGELETMEARAAHLIGALRKGCERSCGAPASADRTFSEWRQAVVEELQQHCLALRLRCAAIEPLMWRAYDAVRDPAMAERGVEALAASRRAATRGRKLSDELEVRADAAPASRPQVLG